MGYVLTISLERYQTAKKKKTERAEETIVWIPTPPKKTNSIVELRDLTERFLS